MIDFEGVKKGINVVLVGRACISIYSESKYRVFTQLIPEDITPKNRLQLAEPGSQ